MSSSSEYVVVCVYPNWRMRNSDNGMIFECDNLLRTRRVSSLSKLKSLILSNLGGLGRKEIRRVGDDPPFTPPPIHVASPVKDIDMDDEDSDKEYVADSNDNSSSEDDDEEEFVPEMPVETVFPTMNILFRQRGPDGVRAIRGLAQGSFRVRLSVGTCGYGLFQSLCLPCHHALTACATASIEWASYVHPVYMQEGVFKVYKIEFPPIPDEALWQVWYGTRLLMHIAS
ncbi:hypothetical protein Ahy_A03g014082 [Arachis hypogaea]|uniref:Zinc finger PMZ-type domain-containing protein n=1 Tax=Arachis hypogaea TaxID=3818 RepID=A0A445DWX9_ARAHY|nr:hypothetical protein Ahy_A03g014082 [Arachis hypogaea]